MQGLSISNGANREISIGEKPKPRTIGPFGVVVCGLDRVRSYSALPVLASRLRSFAKPDDCTAFATEFITQLTGSRRGKASNVRSAFRTPKNMKDLYLLMHEYIGARMISSTPVRTIEDCATKPRTHAILSLS